MSKIEQLYAEWQSLQPLKDEYQQRLNRKFMLEFNYTAIIWKAIRLPMGRQSCYYCSER